MGSRFLPWGIFPDQGVNPRLLHWQVSCLPPSHREAPVVKVAQIKRKERNSTIWEKESYSWPYGQMASIKGPVSADTIY